MGHLTVKQVSRSGTAVIAGLLASHDVLKVGARSGRPVKYFEIEKLEGEHEGVEKINIRFFKLNCCSILRDMGIGDSVCVSRRHCGDRAESQVFRLTRVEVE